MSESVEP
jgi:hypothetical protein